jgi:type IV pilus assembly protein PilV
MRNQDGFGLIEVLVAMVVLAIGVLGMTHLQGTALSLSHSAALRSQATSIAYDILDRMRANRQQALNGAYDGQAISATPPACSATTLSQTTIAARDIQAWRTAMACALPRGTGSIARSGNQFTIVTQWEESQADSTQSFKVDATL